MTPPSPIPTHTIASYHPIPNSFFYLQKENLGQALSDWSVGIPEPRVKVASFGQLEDQVKSQRRLGHRLDADDARMRYGAENLYLSLRSGGKSGGKTQDKREKESKPPWEQPPL